MSAAGKGQALPGNVECSISNVADGIGRRYTGWIPVLLNGCVEFSDRLAAERDQFRPLLKQDRFSSCIPHALHGDLNEIGSCTEQGESHQQGNDQDESR